VLYYGLFFAACSFFMVTTIFADFTPDVPCFKQSQIDVGRRQPYVEFKPCSAPACVSRESLQLIESAHCALPLGIGGVFVRRKFSGRAACTSQQISKISLRNSISRVIPACWRLPSPDYQHRAVA